MRSVRSLLFVLLLLSAIASPVFADSLSLTLDPPGGAVSGTAGSTVGWGFTLSNSGVDFAVISGSDFCVGVISSPCSTTFGTYTDFIGQQFVVVGSTPVTQAFDSALMTGFGSFLINPASMGTLTGELVLFYDLYSVDPNSPQFNPDTDTISLGNYLTTDASVTVTTSTVPTPEPASFLLLASGLLGLVVARKFCT